jgi:hypothetical protein
MWKYLYPKLKPYGHFERIESHETAIGTPDVEYCIGGYTNRLELKYTEKDKGCHLRAAQCGWFKKRVKAKGQPWLLLHANIRGTRSYALIAGADVPPLVHTKDVQDWLTRSTVVWKDKIVIEELIQLLSTFLVIDEPKSPSLILPSKKLTI